MEASLRLPLERQYIPRPGRGAEQWKQEPTSTEDMGSYFGTPCGKAGWMGWGSGERARQTFFTMLASGRVPRKARLGHGQHLRMLGGVILLGEATGNTACGNRDWYPIGTSCQTKRPLGLGSRARYLVRPTPAMQTDMRTRLELLRSTGNPRGAARERPSQHQNGSS